MHATTRTAGSVQNKADVPLSELSVENLQLLWEQMIRNRNYLDVIKLIEGSLVPETPSEERLRHIHHELLSRGFDPLRS